MYQKDTKKGRKVMNNLGAVSLENITLSKQSMKPPEIIPAVIRRSSIS